MVLVSVVLMYVMDCIGTVTVMKMNSVVKVGIPIIMDITLHGLDSASTIEQAQLYVWQPKSVWDVFYFLHAQKRAYLSKSMANPSDH